MINLVSAEPEHFYAGILVAASSAIYGFGYLNREISLGRSFWKTVPVLFMAVIAVYFRAAPLLLVALLLCALGDYFLSRGRDRFVTGLLAFLAGHIAYIVLFCSFDIEPAFEWPMVLIALYSGIFATYMWGVTEKYRWPVMAYIFVISAMTGVSLTLPTASYLIVVGVIIFVFSDSVLAIRMFVVSDPRTKLMLSWAVWASYIAAQSLILIGVIGASA